MQKTKQQQNFNTYEPYRMYISYINTEIAFPLMLYISWDVMDL